MTVFEKLRNRLGPRGWSDDPETLEGHLVEWRRRYHGRTPLMLLPESTEQVADIVRLCATEGISITPQGGNTGLVGGQIPDGEVLLSLKRMNRIRCVNKFDDSLTAEAGVVLSAIHAEASAMQRQFPMSLASQDSATLGGLISTNAGGVHVMRYGLMRDLVAGLEVVLPNAEVLSSLSPLRKDNTGYDLKQLFIGGEGTLGIITAATLRLHPLPRERVVAIAAVSSAEQALEVLYRIKSETGTLSAFELMSRTCRDFVLRNAPSVRVPLPDWPNELLLLEFQSVDAGNLMATVEHVLGSCLEHQLLAEVLIASSLREADQFWHVRDAISGALRPEGAQVNNDIAVPVSRVPEFLRAANAAVQAVFPGVRVASFGHVGDGNIHYTVLQPEGDLAEVFSALRARIVAAVNDVAAQLGGSISAEHGIGVSRRDDLPRYKSAAALGVMRTIKRAIDPQNIMNPRVLLQQ